MDRMRRAYRSLYEQAQDERERAHEQGRCALALMAAAHSCSAAADQAHAAAKKLSATAVNRCRQSGPQSVQCFDSFRELVAAYASEGEAGRDQCRAARAAAAQICREPRIRFH
jgi:hypothetical protein